MTDTELIIAGCAGAVLFAATCLIVWDAFKNRKP
jgi:hypothetical protein